MALRISVSSAKPILGYGPAGWIAACIFVVTAASAFAGVSFQGLYLDLINLLFGADALGWYTVHLHAGHSFSLGAPTYSLISVLYVIPALAIAPMPVAWWKYALVVLWALIHPLTFWHGFAVVPLASLVSDFPHPYLAFIIGGFALECCTCVLLWLITGSRRVLVLSVLITFLTYAAAYALLRIHTLPPLIRWPNLVGLYTTTGIVLGIIWHICIGATLLAWAIPLRLAACRARCVNCGYDLTLSPTATCPECGRVAGAT